jgi:3-oxoacyl-[acyl-carrier protein] reductase
MGRLDGRVAFVTGAGRGIGAATALRMAEEGARVALADVDTETPAQVVREIESRGHCRRLRCLQRRSGAAGYRSGSQPLWPARYFG